VNSLSANEITALLLGIATLLVAARLFGELAKLTHQPAVIGEIIAGIVLGPTLLGGLFPEAFQWLFPSTGGGRIALDSLVLLSIVLFLLVAGLEVDLSMMWRQGKAAVYVGVAGIVAPFALGFIAALLAPRILGSRPDVDPSIYALFFATALSISSVPVIAKTLMDMNLYRSELGMIVIAAAVFNDLIGWILFALILGMMGQGAVQGLAIGPTVAMTLGFTAAVLTIGRWGINRILPWLQAHTTWPGGVLTFALALALCGAAFTEWVGVHAIFGSFLVGVAVGDSPHLREQTRVIIHQFVSFIFAPLFFASIGLQLDFVTHFDWMLVVVVLIVASLGKIVGCGLGALLSGVPKRQAWAIGFGMNARGAMEIILGLLAFQSGLIGERMLVALVIMALVTSMMSGPGMSKLLERQRKRRFTASLSNRTFLPQLIATDRRGAITQLVQAASDSLGSTSPRPSFGSLLAGVLEREATMATGIGEGVAIPHARIDGLQAPVVAAALSADGIDFDAPDGEPARLIFLLLTPRDDDGAQLEILADIARTFHNDQLREKAVRAKNYTEFLAVLKTHGAA
jgi:Kef-type K+ transport system membrane component KefB/mannitol/fructose-specific phosphotransferase system IIA component (Ntr-type)